MRANKFEPGFKFRSVLECLESLPEGERLLADILRQIVLENIPVSCKERLAYNVPFYYGKRRICLIWPASIPRGGFKEGVLLGFCRGYQLKDEDQYLKHGTNTRIFYKIYRSLEDIDESAICKLLKEAVELDRF